MLYEVESNELLRQGEFPIEVIRVGSVGYGLLDAHKHMVIMSKRVSAATVSNDGRAQLFWTKVDARSSVHRLEALRRIRRSPWITRILQAQCEVLPELSEEAKDCHDRATQTCLKGPPGMYLWQGPPGTGKTKAIAHMVTKINLKHNKILISAHSNRAVENVLEALLKEGVSDDKICWIVSGEHLKEGVPETLQHLIDVRQKRRGRTPVHVATCNRAYDIRTGRYSIVILDEAAFCPEPDGMMPLCNLDFAAPNPKFVMVGDQAQLPPVFKSVVGVQPYGSLMGRCYKTSPKSCVTFDVSYRVGPISAAYLASTHYQNIPTFRSNSPHLVKDPRVPGTHWLPEMVFVDTPPSSCEERQGVSYRNHTEAAVVLGLVKALVEDFVKQKDIAIVTGYTAQQTLMKSTLRTQGYPGVLVTTVHAMQGSESRIVILSTVRTKGAGFLDDDHLQCVATSRQKVFLIVVGDARNLRSSRGWTSFLDYLRSHDLIVPFTTGDVPGLVQSIKDHAMHPLYTAAAPETSWLHDRMLQNAFWTSLVQRPDLDIQRCCPDGKSFIIRSTTPCTPTEATLQLCRGLHHIRCNFLGTVEEVRLENFPAAILQAMGASGEEQNHSVLRGIDAIVGAMWYYRKTMYGPSFCGSEQVDQATVRGYLTKTANSILPSVSGAGAVNGYERKLIDDTILSIENYRFEDALRQIFMLRRSQRISKDYIDTLESEARNGKLNLKAFPVVQEGPKRTVLKNLEVDEDCSHDEEENEGTIRNGGKSGESSAPPPS